MRTDRIKLLLLISIGLTLASALITYFSVREGKKRVDWVLHTYEVLHVSTDLLTLVSRAESGVRAYMLSHDSSFLQAYETSKATHEQLLENLKRLTSDNPYQTKNISEKISPYVKYKIEQLAIIATISRENGPDSAVAYATQRKSKIAYSNLQEYMDDFNAHENNLLETRLAAMNEILNIQTYIRYTSLVLIAITLVFSYITINENKKKNAALIVALNESNTLLDEKVKLRTSELDRKNSAMAELNEKLVQSMDEIRAFYDSLELRNQKTEDALHEISDLYNNAPCGYHSLNGAGVFVRINNTELKWLGYEKADLIDKMSFMDILTPDSIEVFKKCFPQYKKDGNIRNLEFELKRKDGSTFPVVLNSTAIYDADGEYVMGRSTVFDISDRKALENKLLTANDSLLLLNEEKNHFLGVAAHDLKSPLHSIVGLINLLRRENSLSPAQKEYIGFIERSCVSMQRLVTNLLDINKIEEGQTHLKYDHIKVSDIVKAQQNLFSEEAASKNIELIFKDTTEDKSIYVDEDALNRVLENLISNALKFSPKNKRVTVAITPQKETIQIAVIDQGPGISKEDFPKLFGRFQKLGARPTNGESSSGLGLSIVKDLVELMKGKITVQTDGIEGSQFIVTLPHKA